MVTKPFDLTRTTLAVLSILGLIAVSFLVLQPFLAATVWAGHLGGRHMARHATVTVGFRRASRGGSYGDDAGSAGACGASTFDGHQRDRKPAAGFYQRYSLADPVSHLRRSASNISSTRPAISAKNGLERRRVNTDSGSESAPASPRRNSDPSAGWPFAPLPGRNP